MSILGWILFGLVVGVVAKFLMPGRDPGGFVITVILGIVGAIVGGFVGQGARVVWARRTRGLPDGSGRGGAPAGRLSCPGW